MTLMSPHLVTSISCFGQSCEMLPVPLLPPTSVQTVMSSASLYTHDRIDSTGWSGNKPLRLVMAQLSDTPRLLQLALMALRDRCGKNDLALSSCDEESVKTAMNRAVSQVTLWAQRAEQQREMLSDIIALICASVLGECPLVLPSGSAMQTYMNLGVISVTETDPGAKVTLPYYALIRAAKFTSTFFMPTRQSRASLAH